MNRLKTATNNYRHRFYYRDYLFIFFYLWGKHVSNAIDRSSQHQTPHQEAEEHHVWE